MGELPPPAPEKPARLVSLDAYRGFIMFMLAASGFSLHAVAKNHAFAGAWAFIGHQFEHVPWRGCTFWDLIQPSFMFMVGVAIPYSYAARKAKGETDGRILAHTAWRSIILIALGIFLSSQWSKSTNWTFMNVLSQIGLGYTFVTLLRGRSIKVQLGAIGAILLGTWLLYVLYPAPGPGFDWKAVGNDVERFGGRFSAHFNKNANVGHAIDLWFLNLFPQSFAYNRGGYQTINFIPSMATMIVGLMAGELLRGPRTPVEKLRTLVVAGLGGLAFGIACDPAILPFVSADAPSLCPIVKRIWTPSFAVFSSGWTLLLLAAFYAIIDLRGHARWAFPFVVVGMNSIAMYVMGQTMKGWVRDNLRIHLGRGLFDGPWGPFWQSTAILAVFWSIVYWMYKRKIFLKV